LLNATPDVTAQLTRWPELRPQEGLRHTPVRGVLLTDSELDHTLGLLHLREGRELSIYATAAVAGALERDLAVLRALRCYTEVRVMAVTEGEPLLLGNETNGILVEWFETGTDLPRYSGGRDAPGAVTGLELQSLASKRRALFVPGIGEVTGPLLERLRRADTIFFDGTFWSEEEFPRVSGGTRSARDMGHLPISGSQGSAQLLAGLPAEVKRYIHINNTNPVLDPGSQERRVIRELGLELAEDGEEVEL
jgi:pyrroloquinoline quinone biosynthesis protein B